MEIDKNDSITFMINLENINWNLLQDAYGDASKIPELLNKVFADKQTQIESISEQWFELWSRLCHQGTIYSASLAAVPLVVEAIPHERSLIDMNFFLLPICIEIARNQTVGIKIPDEIKVDYFLALNKIDNLAGIYESEENDVYFKKIIQATHLVASGNFEDAEKLLD